MIERRNKRKSAPPRVSHAARAIFDDLVAQWAGKAREELAKIAVGRLAYGLTETQRRIAPLIAQGRRNRGGRRSVGDVRDRNTVQTHILHILKARRKVSHRTNCTAPLNHSEHEASLAVS